MWALYHRRLPRASWKRGLRREASLQLWLFNTVGKAICVVDSNVGQSAGNGGEGGFPSQTSEPQALGGA